MFVHVNNSILKKIVNNSSTSTLTPKKENIVLPIVTDHVNFYKKKKKGKNDSMCFLQ